MNGPALPSRFQVLETLVAPDAAGLWRARDVLLGREVLVKRPLAHEGLDEDAERERTLREARALARVKHASIGRLLEVVETEHGPLFVLEPLEGETLSDRLAIERTLSADSTRAIGIEIASALEAVHALGIVHRGVASGNILLRSTPTKESALVLAGFTFAKSGPGVGGAIPGTTFVYRRGASEEREPIVEPPHPAPEQLRGEPADARSDVFGLGWVLYECLTGLPPYAIELELKHWRAPRSPRETNKGIPESLAAAVLKCLALSPADRFPSAASVKAALEGANSSRTGRKQLVVAGGGLAIVIVASLGLRAALADDEAPRGAPEVERGRSVVSSSSAALAPKYSTSRALLIGIGAVYAETGHIPLPNAERDVLAIRAELEAVAAAGKEPWVVETLLGKDATNKAIVEKLRALARAGEPDDKLFVYFAGHGEPARGSEKSGFVLPALSRTEQDDPSRFDWIRFTEFAAVFGETKAKHVLVAMDCCYGGRLGDEDVIAMRSSSSFEVKYLQERAHVVLTSGRANEKVSDGVSGEHSPFARAFLDQFARDGVAFTTTELLAAVQVKMKGQNQTPRMKRPTEDASGEVVFFLK